MAITLDWTFRDTLGGSHLGDAAWWPALGLYVGIRESADVTKAFYSSPDGETWTSHSTTGVRTPARMALNKGLGIAAAMGVGDLSNETVCWVTTDGLAWTRTVDTQSISPRMLAASEDLGQFICGGVGGQVFYSTDGQAWTFGSQIMEGIFSLNVNDAVWAPGLGLYCALVNRAGSDVMSATSPDGINWTIFTWTGHGGLSGIDWDRLDWSEDIGLFVAVGRSDQVVASSPDGENWTSVTDALFTRGFRQARWIPDLAGTGLFVLGTRGPLAWSEDLSLLVTSSSTQPLYVFSPDLVTWTLGTAPGTTQGVMTGVFTVPATVTGLSPASGPTTGGTALTITGTGFSDVPAVTLDGLAATLVTVVNPTTITANAPAHAAGAVDLVVSDAGTLTGAYTYVAPPSLDSVTPRKGPTTGGLNVTLRGRGFTGLTADQITFDGAVVTNLNVVSDTELRCMPAAHAVGLVDVVVAGCGSLPAGYRYQRNAVRAVIQDTDAANLPPIPEPTTPVDPRTGKIHQDWLLWLNTLKLRVEAVKEIDASTIVSGTFDEVLLPTIPWSKIDPAGSSLADLTTRDAGDLSSGTLLAARLPALTGDLTTPAGSVETTLATVNPDTVGTFGSANQTLTVTVNEKGLVTGIKAQPIAPIVPAALTRVNDTNVTATLTGAPFDALLKPVTITLGWLGTLAPSRGGTGTGTAFTAGSVVFAGASGVYSQDNANLFWDDTNNRLGIGTAAPGFKLDILDTLVNTPTLRLVGSDVATFVLLQAGTNVSGGGTIGARMVLSDAGTGGKRWDINSGGSVAGALNVRNATDALNALTILSSGNVGIGSLGPTAALHLKAGTATAGTAPLKLTSGTVLTTAEAGAIEFTADNYFATITTGPARKLVVLSDSATAWTTGSIPFATTNGRLTQDNANLFWDDANNRLGIGTAIPTVPLDVAGASGVLLRLFPGTGAAGDSAYLSVNSRARFGYDGAGSVVIDDAGTTKNLLVTLGGTTRITVLAGGRVGIGEPAPSALLDILGAQPGISNSVKGLLNVYTNDSQAIDKGGSITLGGNITGTSTARNFAGIAGRKENGTSANEQGYLALLTNNGGTLTEALRITSGQLVGVGITPTARLHVKAGSATANTAPLKLTSGPVVTAAEAGAIEFTTDDYFATITTGPARKAFVLDDGARLTSGKMPIATTNGRLIDLTASAAYTITNGTTDRTYDANATTIDELADVVYTMWSDLNAKGILG